MSSTQRCAAAAVGFFALSFASTPVLAQVSAQPAQRGGPPTPTTPYILVTTFHSTDRELGVTAADELRRRVQSEHAARELFAVTKTSIEATLKASGYPPDSALSAADLMELSRQLHGEYVIDGKATKTGPGNAVRFETRILIRTGNTILAQPIPPADGKDPGDAAKIVEKSITEALKGMPMYTKCISDLRAAHLDDAVTSARAGIAAYPTSVLSRICLLNAYAIKKESPDSIISVANQILAADPTSMLALANLVDAYNAKGDKDKAIETNLRIYRVDPSNQAMARSIVMELGRSGAPEKALPIIEALIVDNPTDAEMIRTKWQLQYKAGQFKNTIATGEELVKIDTAAGNLEFYNRQISAAQSDSNPAKIIEFALKAGQKFPTDASFPAIVAQQYRKAGQLPQALQLARRATDLGPKDTRTWLLAYLIATDMNQPDTAFAIAAKAIASGADTAQFGPHLRSRVGAAVHAAQASKARADWDAALKLAEAVDAITSSPETQYYIGASSFSVGSDMATELQGLLPALAKPTAKPADRAQACTLAKQAEDYFAKTSISMPRGGRYDAATAGQILGLVGQYGPFITEVKTRYCTGK